MKIGGISEAVGGFHSLSEKLKVATYLVIFRLGVLKGKFNFERVEESFDWRVVGEAGFVT